MRIILFSTSVFFILLGRVCIGQNLSDTYNGAIHGETEMILYRNDSCEIEYAINDDYLHGFFRFKSNDKLFFIITGEEVFFIEVSEWIEKDPNIKMGSLDDICRVYSFDNMTKKVDCLLESNIGFFDRRIFFKEVGQRVFFLKSGLPSETRSIKSIQIGELAVMTDIYRCDVDSSENFVNKILERELSRKTMEYMTLIDWVFGKF